MRYILLILWLFIISSNALAQTDSTTNIDGSSNQTTGDLNSNTQNSTVNSNNQTTDTSTTTNNYGAGAGSAQPVMSAVAPSLMSNGVDTCLMSKSAGVQVIDLGISGGAYKQDAECNRRRDAKLFKDLGLTVPAISRMCQNRDNWEAMFAAGTPCPVLVNGNMVFGKRAILVMKNNPSLYIPGYDDKTWYGKYKNREYYNQILGIGVKQDETKEDGPQLSITERFRTSVRSESVSID